MYTSKNFVPIDEAPSQTNVYTSKNFIPIDEPQQQEGFLGKALDVLAPGLGQSASIVGQHPILPALATLAKSVPSAAANVGAGLMSFASPGFGDIAASLAQQVPTPSPETSRLLSVAANTALGAPGIESIPELGALAGAGGRAILSKLGFSADKKANDLISNLLGDNSFSKSHLPVLDELRENYNTVKNASNSQYEDILKNANERGYTGKAGTPGISATDFPELRVGGYPKRIVPRDFQNDLSGLDLSQYSKKTQDLLNPLVNKINPDLSFSDAHDLQSSLGVEGAKLRTSADGMQRFLGGELLDLRNTLKNDIKKSFLSNNDHDLAQSYQAASDYFKNNVAPYRENTTIRNVVLKKGAQEVNPSTIGNVLKKDDGSVLPIVNQLSPESKNLLLANQLKSASKELPGKGAELERETDAQKLIDAYGKLDNKGFGDLRTPESNQAIADIMQSLSTRNLFDRFYKMSRVPLIAAAGGALGAGGYHLARETL